MIFGYPGRTSVRPGGQLTVHVATDAPRFRMRVCRWTDGFTEVLTSSWFAGENAPARGAGEDWSWPPYPLPIGRDWPSGVYVAFLEEAETTLVPDVALDRAAVLFVVRGTGRTPILYKLPTATYHAYNVAGGGCFYIDPPRSHDPPGSIVSLHRPGGGIGGPTHGALDAYDLTSPRQTFAHWDARFIAWMTREGIAAEFCTDFDVDEEPELLGAYRLVLSVGHDEYWTDAMRDAVEGYVERGGNIAFFGANVCWWRIHRAGSRAIVCHQGGPKGAYDAWWTTSGAYRPEDALTGVSYRHGGGWWDGRRETSGFIVQDDTHWVFAGTGLRRGERFGAETIPPLVGYECDGVPLAAIDANGIATIDPRATRTGTPPGFTLLAAGPLDARWNELPANEYGGFGEGVHAAAMGVFSRGEGTTFTAATVDWAQVLASGEPRVSRITRNVIERLR